MAAVDDPLTVLREELECAICKDLLENAQILSCKHCFCFECIRKLPDTPFMFSPGRNVTCPICRGVTTLREDGSSDELQSNKLANDMVTKIKKIESERKKMISCQGGDCNQDSSSCTKNQLQRATSYCESCKVAICGNCGMRNHRDLQKHCVLPIKEAVTKRKTILQDYLDWGKSTMTRLQAEKEEQERTLDKCFDNVENDIGTAFARVRRELGKREMEMKTKLHDIKDEFKSTLESETRMNTEAMCLIDKLNELAQNCLDHDSDQKLLYHYQSMCKNYLGNKERLSNTPGKTESCITKLESKVVYESTQETDVQVGKIKYVTEWPLQQFPLKGNGGTAKPSSVITLGEDEKIAVGFQNKPNGEVYERSGKFSHTVGHEPITDMALLTKETIIVLNNRRDIAAQQFNQSKCAKTVLKTHDANTATPNSVAIDHNGKILLLYRSHLDLLSKDGGTLGTMSLDLKHQPSQLRVGQSPDGRTTVVLLRDGETLRLLHLDLSEKKIVEEQHLPCHQPDTRRFGTLDREGHCFIADLRNKGSITIKKYCTDSFLALLVL